MKPSQTPSFPIPCVEWATRLAALHPNDLTAEERMALEHHVADCSACAAAYAAYQQLDARILSLPVVQLSAQQIAQVEMSMTVQTAHDPEGKLTTMPLERRVSPAQVPMRPAQLARRVSALSALAAALVVAVFVGSAFAIFSLRHGPPAASGTTPSTLYTVSYTGTVYSIEPGSGRINWSTPLQMVPDEQFLVSGDTIFVASSCIRSTCELYALQASDGHVLWHHSYKSLLGNTGATSLTRYLASDGQTLYIGSATGIYAWRASDGQQLWQHAPPVACIANPSVCRIDMETVSDGLVYVYFDGLYALNATDGSTRWFDVQVPNLDVTGYPLVVSHNHVYVPNYGGSQALHVLDATTGNLLETAGLPQDRPYEIITDGSVVYIRTTPAVGGSADIYAISASDNQLLWHQHETTAVVLNAVSAGSLYYSYQVASTSAPTSAPAQQAPSNPSAAAVSAARTATLNATTRVCARQTTDGSLQWCQSLPAGFLPSAAASQGIFYATSFSQGLDAIRLSDGAILWHILAGIQLDNADTTLV